MKHASPGRMNHTRVIHLAYDSEPSVLAPIAQRLVATPPWAGTGAYAGCARGGRVPLRDLLNPDRCLLQQLEASELNRRGIVSLLLNLPIPTTG